MGFLIRNKEKLSYVATDINMVTLDSDKINYDNTTSGLEATDVKGAIDELKSENDVQNSKTGKVLWSGSWTEGTITVPNTSDYTLFQICMEGQGTTILAMKYGTHIRGIGGYSSATPTIIEYYFASTFSEDTWTFVACNQMKHIPGGAHGETTICTPISIRGIC